jgi:glycine cleavage system H protein
MSSQVPVALRYAKSHEWVKADGDIVTVGITDHAQHELTDIVFVELPQIGRTVASGEACAVVESVKTASDIYSPVSGKIVAVNEAVPANPALVNSAPYTEGWLFKVALSSKPEVEALLSPADYLAQIGG